MITAVLRQFVACEAQGGLIIPHWVSMYAWPLVCQDGRHLNRLFRSAKAVRPFLMKGEHVKSPVFSGFTPFKFLSLEVDGRVPWPFESKISREFCTEGGCALCT